MKQLIALLTLVSCLPFSLPADAQGSLRYLHEERSLYRNILVTEDSSRRCMRFTRTRLEGQNQSCQFLDNPQQLVFPYAKMTLSSLLVQPDPQRILIVGLGGGTLPDTYHELFPSAQIVVVEIDEAVLHVAQQYFAFPENAQVQVEIVDARVYIKRAGIRKETFDLVILDAFNGEYIPEHLMSVEFLEEVKQLLPPHGMVVANTFSSSRLFDAESVTYEKVFGEIFSLSMGGTGNRVIIASMQALPDQDTLISRVPQWQERLSPYGMDVGDYVQYMDSEGNWNRDERPLTDQYSPANLLNR